MKRFVILSMLAGLTWIAAGTLRADDPAAATDGKAGKRNAGEHIMSKFDKNGDGALQMDELAAFLAAYDKRVAETGKGKEVSPAPTAEKLMTKFDANGDGKLDSTELQSMLKELHARRGHHKKAPPAAAAT